MTEKIVQLRRFTSLLQLCSKQFQKLMTLDFKVNITFITNFLNCKIFGLYPTVRLYENCTKVPLYLSCGGDVKVDKRFFSKYWFKGRLFRKVQMIKTQRVERESVKSRKKLCSLFAKLMKNCNFTNFFSNGTGQNLNSIII